MKKGIFIVMFATFALIANAQSDYSNYLNKALEKLEAGDCEAAQNFYNVYKELSGKSASSVEVLLKDCNREKNYSVGDKIMVGDSTYTVAYIRDGGKHGLAILNRGWQSIIDTDYVARMSIPTLEELQLIYENRDLLSLYDIYWTCTKSGPKQIANNQLCYDQDMEAIAFPTGKVVHVHPGTANGVVLLVHRF